MDQKAKIKHLNYLPSEVETKNSLPKYTNRPRRRSTVGSDINDDLGNSAWYPEQYNASFIAYPR